jgi:hypothetical protein
VRPLLIDVNLSNQLKTMDITQLILDDHHEQRRLFAVLDEVRGAEKATLEPIWTRLAAFLELHAAAEEALFYPALLKVGQGAGSKDSAGAETKDAISDHNEIRDALSRVADSELGSDTWYEAIAQAREANSDHMGEEERESLADFRREATLEHRHTLGVAFAAFEAIHFAGVDAKNQNPASYIEENSK